MHCSTLSLGVVAGLLAGAVNAHGHIEKVVAGGKEYTGGIPSNAPADAVGWAAENQDNGFVGPEAFGQADIICHKGAKPVTNAVAATAGEVVTLKWNTWPESHHGPVIDYLAPVSGDFASVNKESLKWTKVAEQGLKSGSNPGTWASDDLIANGNSWSFTVPKNLKAGNYVLRHEIIALHSAGQENGAQAYPQCINLKVTGSGSGALNGGAFTSFYTPEDPGILFNLYEAFTSYPIPGPDVEKV
ncbi:hypothetical protein FSARC_459 [Fusarium sarcochroum]|uniref:lytic cellulose monooxygenase (C4-dehydrogenating) n=1 Tax=Fusarium sarcochroum TaxID=1208366 RepID=A0A8H4UB96_9HYPO|nr:hypothetical protein FSARC_459 [Fusarium sarcochroum]